VCNAQVPAERVEFLLENNKEITCIKHAAPVALKAIYSGEFGTSDLIFCDKIYNDSVRSKFYDAEVSDEVGEEDILEEDDEKQDL
jgi:hypothetical protein